MQEIAILLSSIAGACTAVAVKKFPKNRTELVSLGTSSHIKNQINSLKIEKGILTKTIARLYQHEVGLTKIQRDKLLLRYQHQLGIILAKIEKLEAASKHPDLGPIGDGLITLMDQKLSQLDNRLYELSSKIALANVQVPEIKKVSEKKKEEVKEKEPEKSVEKPETRPQEKEIKIIPDQVPKAELPKPKEFKPVELTTLTELSKKHLEFPLIEKKRSEPKNEIVSEMVKPPIQEKIEVVETLVDSTQPAKPQPISEVLKQELPKQLPKPQEIKIETNKPKTIVKLPDEDATDEQDDDDLEKIKGEIMKTLSKLEQAEVE